MINFVDRNGRKINVGDVLIYDEGRGYGRSIDEVIELNGELASVMRVGLPEWTALKEQPPMSLEFFKLHANAENIAIHASVVDVSHAEAFTPDYAYSVFEENK